MGSMKDLLLQEYFCRSRYILIETKDLIWFLDIETLIEWNKKVNPSIIRSVEEGGTMSWRLLNYKLYILFIFINSLIRLKPIRIWSEEPYITFFSLLFELYNEQKNVLLRIDVKLKKIPNSCNISLSKSHY